MYRIIGADGRPYGPVSGGQLRQWIAEGRANAQTQCLAEGAPAWLPLGAVPEFAACFAATIPPTIGPLPSPVGAARASGFATAGMICGILSLGCCCCYGLPFNLLGLVFSIIGLAQASRHPGIYSNGQALAGLILSLLSLLLFGAVLIIGLATGNTQFQWNFSGL